MAKKFKPSHDDIRRHLSDLNRAPFGDVLAELLECSPDAEAIKDLATRAPDRWSQAVAILARLAGYSERSEQSIHVSHDDMSDAELLARLEALETGLGRGTGTPAKE